MSFPERIQFPEVLDLSSQSIELANGGGKAANLARLIHAGFQVKPGFVVTVGAYRSYISKYGLQPLIKEAFSGLTPDQTASIQAASAQIQGYFHEHALPPEVATEIIAHYEALSSPFVAVRSSATTEDLEDASFAGLHDTYLNIFGSESLLAAVRDCWASLWTPRAISYRLHHQIPVEEANIAVVVQEMAQAVSSGVLFTANPLTGQRRETVINATYGLGEALVSGLAEPDIYIVDHSDSYNFSSEIGKKQVRIQSENGGGTQRVESAPDQSQVLAGSQITELTKTGQEIAKAFNAPQDIEWAYSEGELYILQSRPITTLFPTLTNIPEEPLMATFSFAAIQGLFSPITPIGRSTLKNIFGFLARIFGFYYTEDTQRILLEAGERLWVNFTPEIKNTVGRKVLSVALDQVEPGIKQGLNQILDDPQLQPEREGLSWKAKFRIARGMLPMGVNVLVNMLAPRKRRMQIVGRGEAILAELYEKSAEIQGNHYEKLQQRVLLLPDIEEKYLVKTFILFISGVAAGMASWNLLKMIGMRAVVGQGADAVAKMQDQIMSITRGMPNNPTTEMDLALWQVAKTIRSNSDLLLECKSNSASQLNSLYQQRNLPDDVLSALDGFIARYGGRGLGEIDLGSPRWADDPTHIFEALLSYLEIDDPARQPDVVFSQSAVSAEQAIGWISDQVSHTSFGWVKARLVRFLGKRSRQLMGMRESPKFFVVRLLHALRQAYLQSGEEFTKLGVLQTSEDILFLTNPEIAAMAKGGKRNWQASIDARRRDFEREKHRRLIPRVLLSDGRAIYEGIITQDDTVDQLKGSPVSPGKAEGKVRVVLDPRKANLEAGEIMVCKGTDPSWTPLFLTAAGLIMETGGMMTHGAVVAREYGIPAIVGVDWAIERLKTGQRIQMDGSSGRIVVLED